MLITLSASSALSLSCLLPNSPLGSAANVLKERLLCRAVEHVAVLCAGESEALAAPRLWLCIPEL